MGFFSADCEGCGHPLLSDHATNEINAWMTDGVAILPNGSVIIGAYDGYGRLDGIEDAQIGYGATVWHEPCWRVAGEPRIYLGESRSSEDQGWFFDDPTHDMPEPTKAADLHRIADLRARLERASASVQARGDQGSKPTFGDVAHEYLDGHPNLVDHLCIACGEPRDHALHILGTADAEPDNLVYSTSTDDQPDSEPPVPARLFTFKVDGKVHFEHGTFEAVLDLMRQFGPANYEVIEYVRPTSLEG